MQELPENILFQNYQVVRVLGKGSFGKVFLIRDTINNRQYAMKKYSKYHLAVNGKEGSLKRSISILERLNHKGIIKFQTRTITAEDAVFLLFEPCKKGNLEQLKSVLKKADDKDIILYILYQLIEALKYLSQVSVAHRDLKPSNITFNSAGQLKLIDFDQAICFKVIEKEQKDNHLIQEIDQLWKSAPRRSLVNSYVGTDNYMSPQMKLRTITDERGDIWAFGCIIFQLISNQTFQFAFEQEQELVQGIQIQINKLKSQKSKIYIDCIDLLEKILVTDPNKRISIDNILNHNYFKIIKIDQKYRQICKIKFQKLLRGNHNLSNPKTVLDAIKYDLIGMKQGIQRFQMLHTAIFMNQGNKKYQLYFLYGGCKYFKLISANNQQKKQYIYYDSIDSIKLEQNFIKIIIKPQAWSRQAFSYQIIIKHLYPQMIQNLYNMMIYILND